MKKGIFIGRTTLDIVYYHQGMPGENRVAGISGNYAVVSRIHSLDGADHLCGRWMYGRGYLCHGNPAVWSVRRSSLICLSELTQSIPKNCEKM